MKKNIPFFLLTLLLTQCNKQDSRVVFEADYSGYFSPSKTFVLSNYTEEVNFWKSKIADTKKGFLYHQKYALAADALFNETGEVNYLKQADSMLNLASAFVAGKNNVPILLSRSSLAIKQHDFKKALRFSNEALDLTDEKFAPSLMMYDAYMELGLFDLAGLMLKKNGREEDFNFIVRKSKYEDHLGNLNGAIELMEKAYSMVENKDNATEVWALSNLSDMYGHAGRIEDSYNGYLKVLEKNPNYLYALRGIAWVAYSHDHDTEAAKRIALHIVNQKNSPDMYLFMAELEEFENNKDREKLYLKKFIAEAALPKYGNMYNKYLIQLYSEKFGEHEKAIELAQKEISNRATPMTYDLLAWTYYQGGNINKAVEIIEQNVDGKTFEPEVIYHMGMIYANAGYTKKGLDYLNDAKEAAYELGPVIVKEIEKTLHNL